MGSLGQSAGSDASTGVCGSAGSMLSSVEEPDPSSRSIAGAKIRGRWEIRGEVEVSAPRELEGRWGSPRELDGREYAEVAVPGRERVRGCEGERTPLLSPCGTWAGQAGDCAGAADARKGRRTRGVGDVGLVVGVVESMLEVERKMGSDSTSTPAAELCEYAEEEEEEEEEG